MVFFSNFSSIPIFYEGEFELCSPTMKEQIEFMLSDDESGKTLVSNVDFIRFSLLFALESTYCIFKNLFKT